MQQPELPKYDVVNLHSKSNDYALVIPTYNEGERIQKQLTRIQALNLAIDVIITDYPSNDGSTNPEALQRLGVTTLVSLGEPGGLSASLRSAYYYAMENNYKGIILMDGNNKDDPAAIPLFIEKLESGYDFIQGSRFIDGGQAINTPRSRVLLIKLIHRPIFSILCGRFFTDTTNGFRGFSRKMLLDPKINIFQHNFSEYELPYFLAWAACKHQQKICEVPVTRSYPDTGPTPTKIIGFKGYWRMLKPFIDILSRKYVSKTS